MGDPIQIEVSELEQFQKSRVWQFMKRYLEQREQVINADLRKLESVPLYRAQGQAQIVDEFQRLPQVLIDIKTAKAKQEESRDGKV